MRVLAALLTAIILSCAYRRPAPSHESGRIDLRFRVFAENGARVRGTVEVLSPLGESLLEVPWEAADGGTELTSSFAFAGPGDYPLVTRWGDEDGGSPIRGSLPIGAAGERVSVSFSRWPEASGAPAVGHVSATVFGDARRVLQVETLQAPTAESPGRFRVTNVSGQPIEGLPTVWPWISREGKQGNEWASPADVYGHSSREERGDRCAGEWLAGWDRGRQPFAANASVTLDEAASICALHPLPPGRYRGAIVLFEHLSSSTGHGDAGMRPRFDVDREVEAPFWFQGSAGSADGPFARWVFPDVPAASLEPVTRESTSALRAPDGGEACVCVGARVGREQLPVISIGTYSVTLRGDGGEPVVLESEAFHRLGDFPVWPALGNEPR